MRIYLDNCSLQRPLDDRTQARINVEAEAILTVLSHIESGDIELLSSEILQFEIARTSNSERKSAALEILTLANEVIKVTDEIEAQAAKFVKAGIKPIDALHLSTASVSKADYFCICDDKMLRITKKLKQLDTQVVSPLQLIAEVLS